jgi:hypothetical protein
MPNYWRWTLFLGKSICHTCDSESIATLIFCSLFCIKQRMTPPPMDLACLYGMWAQTVRSTLCFLSLCCFWVLAHLFRFISFLSSHFSISNCNCSNSCCAPELGFRLSFLPLNTFMSNRMLPLDIISGKSIIWVICWIICLFEFVIWFIFKVCNLGHG